MAQKRFVRKMPIKGHFLALPAKKPLTITAKRVQWFRTDGICVEFFTPKIKHSLPRLTQKTIKNNPFCICFINCITVLSPFIINDPYVRLHFTEWHTCLGWQARQQFLLQK